MLAWLDLACLDLGLLGSVCVIIQAVGFGYLVKHDMLGER